MDTASPKRKIIQKRLRKKERYARMVRIRQRLHDKVALAQVEPIKNSPKYENPMRIYQLPVGFLIGEKNGRLDSEISNLNKTYKSNSVEVLDDDDKLISVTLNKNNQNQMPATYGYLDEWEQRGDPYWTSWAKRLKAFSNEYQEFIQNNTNKFTTDKLDALTVQRYNNYRSKRKEFLNYKSCLEIHKTFNAEGYKDTRVSYNSKCVSKLHYQFDEFVDKLLQEGIPKVVHSKNSNNGFLFNVMMENFQSIFQKPLIVPPTEFMFGSKGGELRKVTVHHMVAGYFAKRTAQVSFLIAFDVVEPIPMAISSMDPSPMYLAQQISNNSERQHFLEKYYPLKYLQMMSQSNSTSGSPLQIESPSHSEGHRTNDKYESSQLVSSGMKIEEYNNSVKLEVKGEENSTPSFYGYN